MKLSKKKRKGLHSEVIPLIDIMTFLVATLVLVQLSMSKNDGLNVDLPGASTSSAKEKKDDAVTLTVLPDGKLFYNKEQIGLNQLTQKLSAFKAANKNGSVTINADSQSVWKIVVLVLDEVKKMGITKVGISTEKK